MSEWWNWSWWSAPWHMRSRGAVIGAIMDIGSTPQHSTEIRLRLELDPVATEGAE